VIRFSTEIGKSFNYFMLWRNGHTEHFYAPYPGHPSADDFLEFLNQGNFLVLKK
jgi:mannan endo-1,4-beta-mannosidase